MAIRDSDPERRNLVVTSLAFIVYYYAGGSFPDKSIRLQVINVDFSHPYILGVIAWVALFWFIYRYWLTHQGSFISGYSAELSNYLYEPYVKNYVSTKSNQVFVTDNDEKEGYYLKSLRWQSARVVSDCIFVTNITRNKTGGIPSYQSNPDDERNFTIKYTDFYGWVVVLRATANCFIKQKSFSSYLVPYLLAVLAIMGALIKLI